MKKAITFSGQSRFVKEGYESLKANLANFNDYDVFVHTWEDALNKDIELYKPKSYIISPSFDMVPPSFGPYNNAEYIHHSMFYSMKMSVDLLKQYETAKGFKYDLIIRTRFDIAIDNTFNPEQYNLVNTVVSPDVCANPKVISDWMNITSSKNIVGYSEIYDNIQSYRDAGVMITAGEEIITHMIKEKGLTIEKVPCDLFLLRERKIHSTLSKNWRYV